MIWLGLMLFSCRGDPKACVHVGCDQMCVDARDADDATCADTASAKEACATVGRVCEIQPDATCGWTVVDAAAYDECLVDVRGR